MKENLRTREISLIRGVSSFLQIFMAMAVATEREWKIALQSPLQWEVLKLYLFLVFLPVRDF